MNEAYLCLGGNLGDPERSFEQCIQLLCNNTLSINYKSSIYKSDAWGMPNAPAFYNQVLKVSTSLGAALLLKKLLETEQLLGRERKKTGQYESRVIDIDIVYFNEDVINEEELIVPHPRMHLRRFVLEPLNEIAPQFIHPVLKKTTAQLLAGCGDEGAVVRLKNAV